MEALRFVVVIFLYTLVFVESFKKPVSYISLLPGQFDTTPSVDLVTSTSNPIAKLSGSDDDETSMIEYVNCPDLNSTLGRTLKWVMKKHSDPKHPPKVRFFLSSRKQPTRIEVSLGEGFYLDARHFTVERRTVVIVHGFKANGFRKWVNLTEEAFLLWGDVNVVVVDWSEGPKQYNYYNSAVNTKHVGNEIARFLHHVANASRIANSPYEPLWGTLHLVGHSLGAHICGVAARNFHEMGYHWRVSRITGLDPAKLCFHGVNSDLRLDSTDAYFVDVIHTSAWTKSFAGFGNPDPIGHVDFYMNGGKTQPGCSKELLNSARTSERHSVLESLWKQTMSLAAGRCSHKRAYFYFIESLINTSMGNCTFWGRHWDPIDSEAPRVSGEPCNANTCVEMGMRAQENYQRGTFFVTTSANSPFCISS